MAIKVDIKEKEKTVETIDFPVLMKAIGSEHIVIFTSKNEGTCLSPGNTDLRIGWHVDRWIACTNKEDWTKYDGEITLKNK